VEQHDDMPEPHTDLALPFDRPDPQHITFTERVLGEQLFPPGVEIIPDRLTEDNAIVTDVRRWAIAIVLRLAGTVGEDASDPSYKSATVINLQQEYSGDLKLITKQVVNANRFALATDWAALQPDGADPASTPRAQKQARAIDAMSLFMQTVRCPANAPEEQSVEETCNRVLSLISSTASGKTAMEALLFKILGVGREPRNTHDSRLTRGLLVITNQALMKQFLGEIGKDTFRRFLGSNDIGSLWARDKVLDLPMQLVSKNLLPQAVDSGLIKLGDYAAIGFDEGHHGLGPEMMRILGKAASRVIYFTATPSRSALRDLRHISEHVEIGSLREDVEDGVISPVQLLSFTYIDDPLPQVAKQAMHYAEQGLKVFIYCERKKKSDPARQAEEISSLINKMAGERIAESYGVHNRRSNDVALDAFFEGVELNILSTCSALREGVDGAVDVVIFIGACYSIIPLLQGIGRAMRPGENVAVVAQHTPPPRPGNPMFSIWQAFGLDDIQEQNFILQPATDETRSRSAPPKAPLTPPTLPEDILQYLVTDRPVRSIMLSPLDPSEITKPDGAYTSARKTAEEHNVPLDWLHNHLDKQGLPYLGVRQRMSDGDIGYERWYESAPLEEYLEANPLPALAAKASMTAWQIAELVYVTDGTVNQAAEALKKAGLIADKKMEISSTGRTRHLYTLAEVGLIIAKIKETPFADPTDVHQAKLEIEVGDPVFVRNYIKKHHDRRLTIPKRHRPEAGVRGRGVYLNIEGAQEVRTAWQKEQAAMASAPPGMGYEEIARRAGVDLSTVYKSATPEELERSYPKILEKQRKPATYFPLEVGQEIVRRLKRQLPPYLVPVSMIQERTGINPATIRRYALANQLVTHYINLLSTPHKAAAYEWSALKHMEAQWGLRSGAVPINYEEVADDPNTTDYDRLVYSRQIQANYIVEEKLPRYIKLNIVAGPEKLQAENTDEPRASSAAPAQPAMSENAAESTPTTTVSTDSEDDEDGNDEEAASLSDEMRRLLIAASKASSRERDLRSAIGQGTIQRQTLLSGDSLPKPADRRRNLAGIPIKTVKRRAESNPSAQKAAPRSSPSIPNSHIDLLQYLETAGAPCAANLIASLSRRHRLVVAPIFDNGTWWARPDDAETMAGAIKYHPTAKPGMVSVEGIAQRFSTDRLQVTEEQIYKLAAQVLADTTISIESQVVVCRIRNQSGTAGKLTTHYQQSLAQRVTSRLEELERLGQLENLRRL